MLGSYLPGRPQDVVASRVSKLTLPRCEVNRWRRVICDGVPGRRRRHGDGESGRHGGPVNLQGSGCGPNFIANSRVHAETERLNASRSRRDDTRPPPCSRRRAWPPDEPPPRSEEHTSELQSLIRIAYAVFCLKKKKHPTAHNT